MSTEPTDDPEPGFETPADYLPHVAVGAMFLVTILGGVLLAPPGTVADAGQQPAEPTEPRPTPTDSAIDPQPPAPDDPGSFANVAPLVVGALLGTLLVLAAVRFGGLRFVRGLFLLVFGLVVAQLTAQFTGLAAAAVAGGAAILLLAVHPEWYVLDALAILAGVFLISEFGQFAGPLPVLALLVAFAAYDAYSVYGSGHMETLAGTFGDLLLPMMYVVPRDLSFSLRDDDSLSGDTRVAALGLGDAIFPGLLAVSGGHFLAAPPLVPGTALNLPALGALAGSAVGYVGLLWLLLRVPRIHAGLPVLNTAVIAGYLAGALAAGLPLATALGL